MKLVVSDTGPLISLEKIYGGFAFIAKLYDKILVPPAVAQELTAGLDIDLQGYQRRYRIEGLIELGLVDWPHAVPGAERLHDPNRNGHGAKSDYEGISCVILQAWS